MFFSGQAQAGTPPDFQLGECHDVFPRLGFVSYAAKSALEQGFFNDILKTTDFTVSLKGVDTECSQASASRLSMPLLLGLGNSTGKMCMGDAAPVIAFNGCTCSDSSKSVANQALTFGVPLVSRASTSPDLSNKDVYKFFVRTIPPDSMAGRGLAKICTQFGWNRIFGIHLAGESYGAGLVNAFCDSVRLRNGTCSPKTIPFIKLSAAGHSNFEVQWPRVIAALTDFSDEMPAPRIIMYVQSDSDWIAYALNAVGLVSANHALMTSEAYCSDKGIKAIQATIDELATNSPDNVERKTLGMSIQCCCRAFLVSSLRFWRNVTHHQHLTACGTASPRIRYSIQAMRNMISGKTVG